MDTKIANTLEALKKNRFVPYHAESLARAREIILHEIVPLLRPEVVSYGDSETLFATKVLADFKADPAITLIDTFEEGVDGGEILERRRKALLSDLFFLGTNALTEDGRLVNLDMVGNRVGGLVFGPRNVVVIVGTNKIVPDFEAAMHRVKHYCGPTNARRHSMRTPCTKTGECSDCKSGDRICNVWTVTDKSYPKGRIHVILVDGEYGL